MRLSSTVCISRWSICMVARFVSSCDGQPSHVCFLEATERGVLSFQLRARVLDLRHQEIDRALDLLLSGLDRLLDEEAGQPVRDLLRLLGAAVVEGDREPVAATDAYGDGAAHLVHGPRLRELRIGLRLREHPLQPRAAQDLRPHRLQPLAGIPGGDLGDEGLGHLLRLDEDRAEDMYFLGRTYRAAVARRRTPAHGSTTSSGRRSGACRKCRNWLQRKVSPSPSSR
jgi:hypothetical protein